MKRPIRALIFLLVLVCLLTGCTDPVGKVLQYDDLSLTLPADFMDLSGESYAKDADFLYGWRTLVFMGLAEKKADLKEMTLDEYTGYVISGNKLTCTPTVTGSGYVFSYEAAVDNTQYTYTTATVEGKDNFWILQFYCPSADLAANQPEIDIILQSIQPNS